ncbi:MAG: hypothetical protein CMI56_00300 [Parcubacteria group bacterium]|nr:hypothetical protein [Parcubacteria group bacterium]
MGKEYTLADRIGRHRFGGVKLQGAVATMLSSEDGKIGDYVTDPADREIVESIAKGVGIELRH